MTLQLNKNTLLAKLLIKLNVLIAEKYFPFVLFTSLLVATLFGFLLLKGSDTNDSSQGPRAFAVDSKSVLAQSSSTTVTSSSNSCAKAGANTATLFGSLSDEYDKANRLGMGWLLSIDEGDGGSIDPSRVCGKNVKVIIRIFPYLGKAQDAGKLNNIFQKLNSLPCEVYVMPLNEIDKEYTRYGLSNNIDQDLPAIAEYLALFSSRVTNGNVKLLSPGFDPRNANTGKVINSIRNVINSSYDGIAVNAYNVDGSGGGDAFDDYSSFKSQYGSTNLKFYITETGMYELGRNGRGGFSITKDEALSRMREAFVKLAKDSSVEAILFFNLFCNNKNVLDNPQSFEPVDFTYGGSFTEEDLLKVISNDGLDCPESKQGSASGSGDFCGASGGDGGSSDTFVRSNREGCFDFTEANAIKSSDIVPRSSNGDSPESLDELAAGVRMVAVSSTDSENPDPSSKNWEYNYKITQQVHNMPLLKYLAAASIEGTESHTFMTDAGYDSQLNPFLDLDFSNQYEGVAKSTDANGSKFIAIPSLGTATAAAETSWEEYREEEDYYCGLYYDEEGNSRQSNANGDQVASIFDSIFALFNQKQKELATKKWFDVFLEQFRLSVQSARLRAQIIPDVCAGKGADSGVAIQSCDNSDTFVLPRDQYEFVLEEGKVSLSPEEMCDNMILSDQIVGGTCIMSNGEKIEQLTKNDQITVGQFCAYFGDPSKCSIYNQELASGRRTKADETFVQLYSQLKDRNVKGETVEGEPYFKTTHPKSEDLALQGYLKALENTLEIERRAFAEATELKFTDNTTRKICHYQNIGIDVQSTRTIWDGYAYVNNGRANFSDSADDISPAKFWEESVNDRDFSLPPDQIFRIPSDPQVLNSNFDQFTKGELDTNRQYWGVAKNVPNELQGASSKQNSQSTVSFIYPWVGQLPLMWQRISYWVTQQGSTDLRINDENTNEIGTKPNQTEQEIGILQFCEDLGSNPTEDCLCTEDTPDPLEEYLRNEGALTNSYLNNVGDNSINADRNGDGIPDICLVNSGNQPPVINDDITNDPVDPNKFKSPVKNPRLTQGFGASRFDYGCQGNYHNGLDMTDTTVLNAPIYASADGKVIWAGRITTNDPKNGYSSNLANFWQYGLHIILEHPGGYRTKYAHLSAINVSVGSSVKQGTQIGVMGTTGNSSGVHLHFEVIKPNCHDWCNKSCFEDPTSIIQRVDSNYQNSNNSVVPRSQNSSLDEFCRPYLENDNNGSDDEDLDPGREIPDQCVTFFETNQNGDQCYASGSNGQVSELSGSVKGVYATVPAGGINVVATEFGNATSTPIVDFALKHNLSVAVNTNFFSSVSTPAGVWGGNGRIGFRSFYGNRLTTIFVVHTGGIKKNGYPEQNLKSQNFGISPETQMAVPCSTDKFAMVQVFGIRDNNVEMNKLVGLLNQKGAKAAVTGVPLLVADGVALDTNVVTGFVSSSWTVRNSRTIIGWNTNGELVMVVLEAATLQEMIDVAANQLKLQCALGLDGGGSSQMYVKDGLNLTSAKSSSGLRSEYKQNVYWPATGRSESGPRTTGSYIGVVDAGESSNGSCSQTVGEFCESFRDEYEGKTTEQNSSASALRTCKVDPRYSTPNIDQTSDPYTKLIQKAVNFVNEYNNKPRIPWWIVAGALTQETAFSCGRNGANSSSRSAQTKCTGDPNEIAYAYANGAEAVGVGQFRPATFRAIINDSYWWRSKNTDNLTVLMNECMDHLGVNRAIGQEEPSDFPNSSTFYGSDTTLKSKYSRKRVGDSICATTIMYAENAAGGDFYKSGVGFSNKTYYIRPENWSEDTVWRAGAHYYGNNLYWNCTDQYCSKILNHALNKHYSGYDKSCMANF